MGLDVLTLGLSSIGKVRKVIFYNFLKFAKIDGGGPLMLFP